MSVHQEASVGHKESKHGSQDAEYSTGHDEIGFGGLLYSLRSVKSHHGTRELDQLSGCLRWQLVLWDTTAQQHRSTTASEILNCRIMTTLSREETIKAVILR